MVALLVSIFAGVFVLALATVHLGMRFLETRDKKKIAGILEVVTETEVAASLLKETEDDTKLSAFQRFLKSINLLARVEQLLRQAGLTWAPMRLLRMIAMFAGGGGFLGIVNPLMGSIPVTCLILGSVGAILPLVYVRRLRSARLAKVEQQIPDAMDYLARAMRAGHAFSISVGMVGNELPDPLGHEFRTLFNEQNLGASVETTFHNFTRRVPLLDARFFASAVMLQRRTGGNLAEILARLAEVIRERFRLKGQVKAVSAHGRMTAGILTFLPVVTAIALTFAAPGYLQGMLKDPDGQKLILGAVLSQVIGNFVIGKIVKIKV